MRKTPVKCYFYVPCFVFVSFFPILCVSVEKIFGNIINSNLFHLNVSQMRIFDVKSTFFDGEFFVAVVR